MAIPDGDDDLAIDDPGRSLTFELPAINVAMFNAPAVDAAGNVYMTGASLVSEGWEIARAAKQNGTQHSWCPLAF